MTDEELDLEFAYVSWDLSCKDIYTFNAEGEILQCCRRLIKHDGEHASGFGAKRKRWSNADLDTAPVLS